MIQIGFDKNQISLIRRSCHLSRYNDSDIMYSLKKQFKYFSSNSFSNEEFIKMISTVPNILCTSVENIKTRIKELMNYSFNKIECFETIKRNPYIFSIPTQTIDNKFTFFEEHSFDNLQIKSIIYNMPEILNIDNSIIEKKINSLIKIGYSKKDVTNIICNCPNLINMTLSNIKDNLNILTNLGFNHEEIITISSYLPTILIDSEIFFDKINFIEKYGFNRKTIIDIIKKIPFVLKKDYMESIDNILSFLYESNFSKNETISMIERNVYILVLNIDIIRNNYNYLSKINFSNDCFKLCPLLLTYNLSSLKDKIKFYKKIDVFDILKNNPSYLLYNLDFIKKRYTIISRVNSSNVDDLFINDYLFFDKYHIEKNDILKEEL